VDLVLNLFLKATTELGAVPVGFVINGRRFADDIAAVTGSEQHLEMILYVVIMAS